MSTMSEDHTNQHKLAEQSAEPAEKDSPADVEQTKEIDESLDQDYGPAPEGGLRAWLVAIGGFCILFCCLGFSNSFGIFEEYYLTHQLRGESSGKISWVGSLSAFLQFFGGLVGGPMFDRFGAGIIRPAAVLYIFAMMMLSLCKEYWQIMLVQGVLQGLCMGFLNFPAFAAVTQYFEKKRATAMGIVVSGSSVGGVIIPIALSKLLNSTNIGFGWSVRIIGFIMLPFLAFACVAVKARLPSRKTTFWISSAYRSEKFVLLILACFFMFLGMFTPIFYIPTYGVYRGMSPALSGYLSAILNAASTFGRIIPALLADKYGRLNAFALGGIISGIIVFCMNSATSNAGIIVYTVMFGFWSGSIISGASAAFTQCVDDVRNVGTYLGMGLSIAAFGGLIGPPVNGAIESHYGGFFQVSMFSGAMCLFGGILGLAAKATTSQGLLGRI